MEIKINKQYIHTKEDFIKYIKEQNKDINPNIFDENKIFENIILVKNYITTKDLNDILQLEMFKFSLNKIIKINLTANNLESIPEIFRSLSELKIVILNNNKIQKISNLENLSKLEKLELRGNKITKIENLNHLQKLNVLTLSCNLINNIEENDFPKIDELKELGLFGNYLGIENKKFDKTINENNIELLKKFSIIIKSKFKSLKGLYIGGNFFTNLINISNDNNDNYKNIIKSILPTIIIDGQN
jgi:Leucine-rich repeat (LRR) protein